MGSKFTPTNDSRYSSCGETRVILDNICTLAASLSLPAVAVEISRDVAFTADRDFTGLTIPFKETEMIAALKAVEVSVASALEAVRFGLPRPPHVTVNLEKATAFLFQAY
jgi:hypothetical protein